ncbi:MAG: hypothetical protein ACUVQP_12315 [Bacteroidales bacterium]
MSTKKKINKLKTQHKDQQPFLVWGIITQKKTHALAKDISDILEISFELIEDQEFHIFGHLQTEASFVLIKNHKRDIFSEIQVDYLFIVINNNIFDNLDTYLFKPLKNKQIIQGAYLIALPSKINKIITELLQTF